VIWECIRAVAAAWVRGIVIGIIGYVLGLLLIGTELIPSGAEALALLGWMIGSSVMLAPRLRAVFDRMPTAGLPLRDHRTAFFFPLFIAGAAALLLGLFFEALVYSVMTWFGVINPYFCILAFGLSFGSFWFTYAAASNIREPQQNAS
jgi:hypothetical protein